MPVTLAGVPLCLFGRGAGEFVNRYCPWDIPAHFNPDATRNGLQGLPWTVPPPEPAPRVGVLRWPTGATRWATAHFLVSDAELDVFDAFSSTQLWSATGPTARELKLIDGTTHGSITTDMYALPVRPLGTPRDYPGASGTSDLGLHLLTLVDERYFWWWQSANITAGGSWADLFEEIADGLGITITLDTAVDGAFEAPDLSWAVGRQPLPVLLDAAAQAIGRRVVRQRDGTVLIQTYTEAKTAQDLVLAEDRTAGGRFNPDQMARTIPSSLVVVAPGGAGETEVSLSGLSLDEFDGITGYGSSLVIEAAITASGASGFATALSEQWYLWRLAELDWICPGVADIETCGLFDAVEWEVYANHPMDDGRSNLCLTRAMRPAWDDGITNARSSQGGSGDGKRWLRVKNESGEEAPAYALLRITGYETAGQAFTVDQPNQDDQAGLIINSGVPIPDEAYGRATMDWPCYAGWDDSFTAPDAAQEWGAKSGEWLLSSGQQGFRVLADAEVDPDRVWVYPTYYTHVECSGSTLLRTFQ